MPLILASNSPRRHELLRNAGIEFVARPAEIDEKRREGESVGEYVRRLARAKALSVARLSLSGELVLGADTAVEIDGQVLGKPADAADAARMLRRLSGATHHVISGICLVRAPDRVEALQHETTAVTFRCLSDEEIQRYISTGEPFDKAGAYGIQGFASKFVIRIEGCFFNVVGLPVALLCDLLESRR